MPLNRSLFDGKPLEHVADRTADAQPGSQMAHMGQTEFLLRQTQAAQDTADATRRYTRYMFWSVVVLAASALGTFVIQVLSALNAK